LEKDLGTRKTKGLRRNHTSAALENGTTIKVTYEYHFAGL
jgi:hypothetical protein